MPTFALPSFSGSPDQVADELAKLRKELNFSLNHLDHENIQRIYTEYCDVRSECGETVIDGPTLKMYDTPAVAGTTSTGVLRLKMGYSTADSDFVFQLFDQAGNLAVGLNSTGQLLLSGRPLIQMYDNTTMLRLQMGQSTVTDDFMFELYNATGGTQLTLNSSGDVVFRGILRSGTTDGERIEIEGNALITYNSSNHRSGPAWGSSAVVGGNYGDMDFYDDGVAVMRIANQLSGNGYAIEPIDAANLYLGAAGKTVLINGDVLFGGSLGFFGAPASTKIAVADLSTDATLPQTIDKLNGLLNALQGYGLV
jgi:hypothetical protein